MPAARRLGLAAEYKDEYQQELRKIIDAKIAGEEVVMPTEEAPPKVVNLMEALRQSLERVSSTKKRAARIDETEVAAGKAPARAANGRRRARG